ncbi:MAG TPA: hypothetical protein VKE74_29275 [Gemmataceae bacterium]|nr:hypothetical protein [Gemmataceae bacterium]
MNPFVQAMLDNPGDANTLVVAADFIEEAGGTENSRNAEWLRELAPAVRKAWAHWVKFDSALRAEARTSFWRVGIQVMHNIYDCKERAARTRALFKRLGLAGVSVIVRRSRTASGVCVRIPARLEGEYLEFLDPRYGVCHPDRLEVPSRRLNVEACELVEQLLDRAFPEGREEWFIRSKDSADYGADGWSNPHLADLAHLRKSRERRTPQPTAQTQRSEVP